MTTSAGTGSEGFWNQDGTLQDFKVKALSRSYMPYTQGTLTSIFFETTSAALHAVFTYSDSINADTVVYLNQEYWYETAPTVSLTVNGVNMVDMDAMGHSYENNYFSFDLHNASEV